MASTRIADHIGRVLGGRYRIAAAIGTGASAHVFLADDVRLGRRVAVKVLHPALAGDPAFLRRFRAEARAAAALSHPHILAVYDWGEEEDGPFIVTEFLGGGSLRAMLDRGHRLTPSQALLVGLEAARGLDYAHRRGLVHRDIKPANLLFDDEGRLRIADFGLARALAEAAWTEPTGTLLGTARYAAPEQVRGTPLDGKADVYALAVLLVESVTGRVPFAADTTVGTILSRLERPLEVPAELGPMVPLLSRAGLPDPVARPDAMALGAGLHGLASELPSPEPLPLAGPAMFDEIGVRLDSDPTDMGMGTSNGSGSEPAPTVPDLAVPAGGAGTQTAVVPVPIPAPAPAEDKPSKAGRRRRRWPRVALAVVVALVCSAVGAAAFVQAQTPTHELPDVREQPSADAKRNLDALGFTVVLDTQYFDDKGEGSVVNQRPAPGVRLKEGKTVTLTVSLGRQPVDVPDLTGQPRDAAVAALTEAGLNVADPITTKYSETVGDDVVIDWEPKAGSGTRKGDTVKLTVSDGPQPRTLPDVSGKTYEQAAAQVQGLGLVAIRAERYDDEVAKDRVIGTRPPVGNSVPRGTTVEIVVSSGQPVVPNLNGMTSAAAKTALEAVDLRLGQTYGPNNGRVILTVPAAGTKVNRNSSVNVYLA
ncbi:MAG: PASTA domain-containing protein [Acidimicrobiales bacterium]